MAPRAEARTVEAYLVMCGQLRILLGYGHDSPRRVSELVARCQAKGTPTFAVLDSAGVRHVLRTDEFVCVEDAPVLPATEEDRYRRRVASGSTRERRRMLAEVERARKAVSDE